MGFRHAVFGTIYGKLIALMQVAHIHLMAETDFRQIEIFLDPSHRPPKGVNRQVTMFSWNSETDLVSTDIAAAPAMLTALY